MRNGPPHTAHVRISAFPTRDIAIIESFPAGREILSKYNIVNLVSPNLIPSLRIAHVFNNADTIPQCITVYVPAEVARLI